MLNVEQKEAVEYATDKTNKAAQPLLIIAGAGTGKTNTLAHKTAQLILNGVAPERILLMTFARRAAQELASRANNIVVQQLQKSNKKAKHVKLPWIGTFHSIANRFLHIHAESIGLASAFSVMDKADAADMLDLIRHQLGFSNKKQRFPTKKTCLDIYSKCVNTQQPLIDILNQDFPYYLDWEKELKTLFSNYNKQKIEQASLDYDDLLLYCYHMAQVPEIADKVRQQFDYILVDEYQDTNLLQAGILSRFFPDGRGLTVVGDDAQSIYSFRSATVDNILNFPDQFSPPAKVVSLTENYRSHQGILDLSNQLLAEGDTGFKVKLKSQKSSGEKPKLVNVSDDLAQAEYIIENVLKARESGLQLRQQAVLFRTGYHSDRLEVELTRQNIPYVKYGGLKFLEAAHVKDFISLVRWADNPKHQISSFRILKLLPGIGPKLAEAIHLHLVNHNEDFEVLNHYPIPSRASELWSPLITFLTDCQQEKLNWHQQIEQAAKCYEQLMTENYDDHFVREGDIEQLTQMAFQFNNRSSFLAELILDPPQSSGDLAGPAHLDEDFLILSTIHSAKGQEWNNVHILNVADGNFPNEYAVSDSKKLAEERRLLNVAITRAKDELHLIQPFKYWVPEQQKYGDKHVYGAKSRFLTNSLMEHLEKTNFPKGQIDSKCKEKGQNAIADIKSSILNVWSD